MEKNMQNTFDDMAGRAEFVPNRMPVALCRCSDYARARVQDKVGRVLECVDWRPARGTVLVVKPNLLRVQSHGLCCTHPEVIRAAVLYARDHGAIVTVGDSPAFGSALRVAGGIGLVEALQGLDVPVVTLDDPVVHTLPSGIRVHIARRALECDAVLNVPRLKAHCQMRLTLAVKNMFGCVSGVHKALAHAKHGERENRFVSMLVELGQVLPPTSALLDGIVAMHRTGPSGGSPFALGLLGASQSCVALDTSIYGILGMCSEEVPIWKELQQRNHPEAFLSGIHLPLDALEDFDASGFRLPQVLDAVSFRPGVLLRSMVRRIWYRYGPMVQKGIQKRR